MIPDQDKIKNLAPALVSACSEIDAAVKDSTNPHFKSKYADLSSVIDAVKKPLANNGLAFVQDVNSGDNCVSVTTIILHKSGESLSLSTISVPVSKADAQGYGSAITYAKRYSLQSALGVPSEDDDGNAAVAAAPIKAAYVKPLNPISAANLETLNLWLGGSDQEKAFVIRALAKVGANSPSAFENDYAEKAIAFIKTQLNNK